LLKQQIKNTAQHTNFALQPTTSTGCSNKLTLHWLHDHQLFRFYVFNTFIVPTTAERNKTLAASHNAFGPARTTNISFNCCIQVLCTYYLLVFTCYLQVLCVICRCYMLYTGITYM